MTEGQGIGGDQIDSVLQLLREMERKAQLNDKLAVGELLFERFFDRNPDLWHEKRRKSQSIRRLAAREGCPLRKSALHAAVAVYVAALAMPWIRNCEHVSTSHVKTTLTLCPEGRAQLLRRAEQERWSVRRLGEEVIACRWASGERRGRPPLGASQRAISVLRPFLMQLKPLMPAIQKDLFDSPEWQELYQLTQELAAFVAELESVLAPLESSVHTRGQELRSPGIKRVHTRGHEPRVSMVHLVDKTGKRSAGGKA